MPEPVSAPNWAITSVYVFLLVGLCVFTFMAGRYLWRFHSWGRLAILVAQGGAALFVAYRIQLRLRMQDGWLGPNSVLFLITLAIWAIGIWAMILAVRQGAIMRKGDGDEAPPPIIPRRRSDDWT